MAAGATVDQAGADRQVLLDVAGAVTEHGPLALGVRELALEELTAAPDGAEGVAFDDEEGGARRPYVTAAGSDLLLQRLVDALPGRVRGQGLVDELGHRRPRQHHRQEESQRL